MLCPEVVKFPPPKVFSTYKQYDNVDSVLQTIGMNNFYKSVMITCPDEVQIPALVQEQILDDNEYYSISNVSLTEFLEPTFVESFVKKGNLYCLSTGKCCITHNCAAITPDGSFTLHLIEHVFQTTGFEGTKRPHNFYEVKIDLKQLKHVDKIKCGLSKLELFDFRILWEPHEEDVCPSSIAKYFHDRKISVSLCPLEVRRLSLHITEIPALEDVDIDEMVEWLGMLAHEVDMNPGHTYISTYSQPESDNALRTNRISVLIVKGLFSQRVLSNVCKKLAEYTLSRELDKYWASISVQSYEESLWQWNTSSPKMFQSHDSSCNIFFTKSGYKLYSIGQLKYS